jgi:hypothetical protein
MKQLRRYARRGVLVPLALFALIMASSLPANAASANAIAERTEAHTVVHIGPLSLNW